MLFLLQTGSHNNDSEKTCQTTACQEVICYHGRFPLVTIATLFSTRLAPPDPLCLYDSFLLKLHVQLKGECPSDSDECFKPTIAFSTGFYLVFITFCVFIAFFNRVFIAWDLMFALKTASNTAQIESSRRHNVAGL